MMMGDRTELAVLLLDPRTQRLQVRGMYGVKGS